MTFSGANNWGKSGNPTYSGASLGVGCDGAATAMQPQSETVTATTAATTKPCGCKDDNKKMYYHLVLGALIGAAIVHFYNKG